MVKNAIALSICGQLEVALLYRWKGVEKANSWVYRARKEHDLLLRALKRMWPAKVIRHAERQAAEVGQANVPDAAKRAVRAASVITSFSNNLGGADNEAACLLNAPLQHYLNAAFAAEAATTIFVERTCRTSTESTVEAPETVEARADAKQKNLGIISGRRGEQAVRECFAMMKSYSTGAWAEVALPRHRKHALGCSLVRLITDAWWRLVFYYRQPKFEVFAACALEHQDQTLAAQICTPLEQRGVACHMCLDRFARIWIARLSSSIPSPVLKYLDIYI